MNLSQVSDNLLQRMSAKDRKGLGLKTAGEAQAAFVAKSEKGLQQAICNLLRLRGIWFAQSRMDRKTTTAKGTPDFIFPYHGLFVAWEVKHGKGKLSEDQIRVRDAILEQGGEWMLITSLAAARWHLEAIERTPRP